MEQLGIDAKLLIAQIINFAILLLILKRFLYKPVLKAIVDKKEKTEAGVALQDELVKKEDELEQKKKKMLSDVKLEGRRVVQEAIEEAKKKQAAITQREQEKNKIEHDKMIADVKKEREKIIDEAKKQSVRYAVLISEKVLHQKMDKQTQKQLIEESLKELKK